MTATSSITTNLLHSRYLNRLKSFKESFHRVHQDYGDEDIHSFRVAIKRIRALMALLDKVSPGNNRKKSFNHFLSPLFRSAGFLRENQINFKLIENYIEQYDFLPLYLQKLKDSLTKGRLELNVSMDRFDFISFDLLTSETEMFIQEIPDKLVLAVTSSFIGDHMNRINELKERDNKLHKIRIRLRAVGEIVKLVSKMEENYYNPDFKQAVQSLNDLIGEWHDDLVLIDSLKRFESGEFGISSKVFIGMIEDRKDIKQAQIYRSIDEDLLVHEYQA